MGNVCKWLTWEVLSTLSYHSSFSPDRITSIHMCCPTSFSSLSPRGLEPVGKEWPHIWDMEDPRCNCACSGSSAWHLFSSQTPLYAVTQRYYLNYSRCKPCDPHSLYQDWLNFEGKKKNPKCEARFMGNLGPRFQIRFCKDSYVHSTVTFSHIRTTK